MLLLAFGQPGAISIIHHRMPTIIPPEHYGTWLGNVEERKQLISELIEQQEAVLKAIAVEDIWGIGRSFGKFWRSQAITNALQFKNAPE